MSNRFDVLVIGGGVIGCSIAYHLAKKKLSVVLLEKDAVAARASGGAPGILAAQEETAAPSAFFDACVASREAFATLAAEVKDASGIDPELDARGVWRVAATAEEKTALLARKKWQEERGHAVEWHDAAATAARLPSLAGPFEGALFFPRDGHINGGQWTRALAEAARRRGARVVEHVPQVELTTDGRAVTGARTPTENFPAGHVVLAAGAWTPHLAAGMGLELPVEPVKGQLLFIEGFPALFQQPVFAAGGYCVQKPDGRLIIGTTQERAGFDQRPTLAAQRGLADWAARWCPSAGGREVLGFWAGLRPATPDGWPFLGPLPGWDGVSVCAGHFRNGILLSPFSGRFMADGIADDLWDPLGRSFSPARLTEKIAQGVAWR